MRKRLLAILCISLLSFGLISCGKTDVSNMGNTVETENAETGTNNSLDTEETDTQKAQDTEEGISSEGENTTLEGGNKEEEFAPKDLYNAFLQGEALLYADADSDFNLYYDFELDNEIPILEEGVLYSLTAFVTRWTECYSDSLGRTEPESFRYCYIDCGADGEEELVLKITMNTEYDGPLEEKYIIKAIDGKLKLCYRTQTVYRIYEDINNSFGIIQAGGSGGAFSGGTSYAYINGEGEYVYLYGFTTEYALGYMYAGVGGIYDVAAKYSDEIEKHIEDDWYLEAYSFEDPMEDDGSDYEEYLKKLKYAAYPEDEPLIDTIFEEAGIRRYSSEEIDELIEECVTKKGITKQQLEKREDFEWKDIENDELEEMAAYGIKPVFVSNTEEFLEALSNNANIILEPGEYNVTQYLREHKDKIGYIEEYSAGVCYSGTEESPELNVVGLNGLRISSKDPENMAVIVSEPRDALVMHFDTCRELSIENVVMGHTPEQGTCGGDVIGFTNCNNAKITGCDLYGCGAYGAYIYESDYVYFEDTTIHDCTYGCLEMYYSESASFYECEFINCEGSVMFWIYDGTLYCNNSNFKNLDGEMLYMSENSSAVFGNCTYDAQASASLQSYDGEGNISIY